MDQLATTKSGESNLATNHILIQHWKGLTMETSKKETTSTAGGDENYVAEEGPPAAPAEASVETGTRTDK